MNKENLVLMVQRKMKASPERLFEVWTRPEYMKQWFYSRAKKSTPVLAEADLTVGGPWRLVVRNPDGVEYPNNGKYLVIDRPNKLVFTWHPMGQADYETKVTLSFKKISEEFTEMTLTHEGFRNQDDCDKHQMGWNACIDNMEICIGG